MSRADLLLGVDGGGSRTRAVVADLEGNVLGRGLASGSNYHKVGVPGLWRALRDAIETALSQAAGSGTEAPRLADGRVAAACFGMSSVDRPVDRDLVSRWIREQGITSPFVVVNDAEPILAAGTPEGWGVALISGTGSVCFARSKDGRTARTGGWGHLLGDEGSGYRLGVEALRLAAQAADGRGQADAVLRTVLSHWRLEEAEQLLSRVYRAETTPADIAELALPILAVAAGGDPAARQLVEEAAGALAHHVDAVVRKLDLRRPPIALGGGLLSGSAELRDAVRTRLRVEVGPFALVADPTDGALLVARRLLASPPARAVNGWP